MNLPLDNQASNSSYTAEDLASDDAQKGTRKATAKRGATTPPPPGAPVTAHGAPVPALPPEGVALMPLNAWQTANPLPQPDAPLRDWAIALHGAGLSPVRGYGVVTPATPCECADKKTCEHGARCTCRNKCASQGKHPIGTGWQDKNRTFDPDVFIAGDNIGLLMGVQRGGEYLIALDVDDHGRMITLMGVLGDPGPTMVGRSARGERRIYRLGDDVPRGKDQLKNITGLVLEVERQNPPPDVRPEAVKVPGVDCKVDGGYLVVGPSLHPTGARYEWTSWREPAELPAGWVQALLAPKPRPKALEKYSPRDFKTVFNAQRAHQKWIEDAVAGQCRLIAQAASGTSHHTVLTALAKLWPMARGIGGTSSEMSYIVSEVSHAAVARQVPVREIDALIRDTWNHAVENDHRREMPERNRSAHGRQALVRYSPDASRGEAEPDELGELERETGPRVRAASNNALTLDDKGCPTKTAGNVAIMLADYPGGPPRYNEFHDVVTWPDGRTYDEASDLVDVENWLLDQSPTVRAKPDAIDKGIAYAARKRAFHPVRDYLRGLTWDKTPRVERLFSAYFGAMHSPYVDGASRCFMAGAVARILRPGCKLDTMPVLEGKQGTGKSRALRVLAGEWFSDSTISDKSPDCFQALRGVWIYELAELASVGGRETERIKAYVSSAVDRYRTSYARRAADVPRQVMFAGTTNARVYLSDSTGARRFHPVACGVIDLEALASDRDQLWAEAVVMFDVGVPWHLSRELDEQQRAVAAEREHEDPWAEAVAKMSTAQKALTVHVCLAQLGIETGRQTRSDEMRLSKLLQKQGWTKTRPRVHGVQTTRWSPPPAK